MYRRLAKFAVPTAIAVVLVANGVLSVASAGAPEQPSAKDDLAEIRGSWTVKRIVMNGKETGDREVDGSTMTLDEKGLTWAGPQGRTERFEIEIDATTDPPSLHVDRVDPLPGQEGWMVFKRNNDRLKIAFFDALRGRPTGFEPQEKLIVLDLSPRPE